MPYASRAADGTLVSLQRQAPGHPCEFLDAEHPEVQAFLGPDGADAYERLDADFIRVLEDLIDVLLRRHVIALDDLPVDVQKKLSLRKHHRQAMPPGGGSGADGAAAPQRDRCSA